MATPVALAPSVPRTGRLPRILLVIGRVALGLIFIYGAYAKLYFDGAWHLSDYQFFFSMAIDSYKMLPIAVVQAMAAILPWFELALGVLLISGVGLRWVGLVASSLLVVFLGAMLRAKILGLEINCGCFGNNEKLGTATLIRDSTLLILALGVTVGAFVFKKPRRTVSL